ncbi:MAG: hypothetical protein FWC94_01225 [Bacteroidales bacterium]|nr:hypothetical protein [Bacteroidales bacterium]
MKKFISVSKRKIVKLVKFTRELSIVVIGVGIALMAGDFLSSRSAKKDLRNHLKLVENEIASNIAILNMTIDRFTQESSYATFLRSNRNNPNAVDSLGNFVNTIFDFSGQIPFTSAFNLLVASQTLHLIQDKELLQLLWLYNDWLNRIYVEGSNYLSAKIFALGQHIQSQDTGLPLKNFYLEHSILIIGLKETNQFVLSLAETVLENLKNLRI